MGNFSEQVWGAPGERRHLLAQQGRPSRHVAQHFATDRTSVGRPAPEELPIPDTDRHRSRPPEVILPATRHRPTGVTAVPHSTEEHLWAIGRSGLRRQGGRDENLHGLRSDPPPPATTGNRLMSAPRTHRHRARRCTCPTFSRDGHVHERRDRRSAAGNSETPTDSRDTLHDHRRPPLLSLSMTFERPCGPPPILGPSLTPSPTATSTARLRSAQWLPHCSTNHSRDRSPARPVAQTHLVHARSETLPTQSHLT